MATHKILLITDEKPTEAAVREALSGQEIETADSLETARQMISSMVPPLLIIDYELKELDGLQAFKQLHLAAPKANTIMLSSENNISLAVTATKLGVADFLRKPISAPLLRESVARNLPGGENEFVPPAGISWLQGGSAALKKMYAEIRAALAGSGRNLLIVGEPGSDKQDVAAYIHAHSPQRKRGFKLIDLADFQRPDLEPHFWASLQEAMAVRNEDDRCGTLYLDKIEVLETNFRASIFQYARERREKTDKEMFIMIGLSDKNLVREAEGFLPVSVPALRERKEDLPFLLAQYLRQFSVRCNKPISGFAADVLDLLTLYDYPGNYQEMSGIVEQAVLVASTNVVELKDLPMDFRLLQDVAVKQALRQGKVQIKEARQDLEKNLYRVLLKKSGGNVAAVARFLDLPRTTLSARLEELGCDPAD